MAARNQFLPNDANEPRDANDVDVNDATKITTLAVLNRATMTGTMTGIVNARSTGKLHSVNCTR